MLGGEIRLDHREGGGTTARVTHPMMQPQRAY